MTERLLHIHAAEHNAQAHIALFEIGHGSHDLLIGHMVADFLQLICQIGQLLGVGGVVTDHVFHQRHQLFHGGVLTLGGAAVAVTAAVVIVGMVVVMMVMMIVRMLVGVIMGMIVMMMFVHVRILLCRFFLYYTGTVPFCQNIYFFANNPREGLRKPEKKGIIHKISIQPYEIT